MCGLAGAGKSTHAKRLEAAGWLRLSIDVAAWDLGYSVHPLPRDVRDRIVSQQRDALEAALRHGTDVVVDYSFWSRKMRDEYRAIGRSHNAAIEVVFFDVPGDELRRRLRARALRDGGPDAIVVDDALLDQFASGFERPKDDETDVRVVRS